ncbi:MAG: MobA/MobL family protein [Parachlamydiaceae bacterium]
MLLVRHFAPAYLYRQTRSKVFFWGHKFAEAKEYDWSFKETPSHSEILLPDGVDQKFKKAEILWNHAEKVETRKNSQSILMVFWLYQMMI